jgi:hypothetical protein
MYNFAEAEHFYVNSRALLDERLMFAASLERFTSAATERTTGRSMNEDHRKHLEFIQQVVTRANSNSFQLKGWTVTMVAALAALSAADAKPQFAWIAAGAVIFFWSLDAYYLRMERSYRALYDNLRAMTDAQIDVLNLPYSMQPESFGVKPDHLLKIAFRSTVCAFHFPLFVCAILVRYLLT